INRSEVRPGDAGPGTLTVNGNYTQGSSAHLLIDIAGSNPDEVSLLSVLGAANLSGFLNPVLQDGFIPSVGESFTFLEYGSLSGSLFIFNPNIDGVAEHWVITYQPTYAVLTAVAGNVSVPDQPSTLFLMILSLAGLLMWRGGWDRYCASNPDSRAR